MNGVEGKARVEFSEPRSSRTRVGRVFGQDAFGIVPGAGGRAVHGGIGIENAAPIGIERLRALFRGQHAQEIVVETRIEARQGIEKGAFQLGAGAKEGGAQARCPETRCGCASA